MIPARLPLGESHCLELPRGRSTNELCLLPEPWNADERRLGVPGDSDLEIKD